MNSDPCHTLLHIGYPKTATSWFQKKYFPNIDEIDFYNRKRLQKEIGIEWKNIKDIEPLIEVFRNKKQRIVISDESMIGGILSIERNVKIYRKIFHPAQVIIFIRNQLDAHVSAYSQYIKLGGTARFTEYLFPPGQKVRAGRKHQYHEVISLYKEYFSNENVYVYLFEEFCEDQLSFVRRFCKNHQLDYQNKIVNLRKVNVGLSPTLLNLKRLSNYLIRKRPHRNPNVKTQGEKSRIFIPYWFEISFLLFEFLNNFWPGRKRISIDKFIDPGDLVTLKNYYKTTNEKLIKDHKLHKIEVYSYPL